MTASELTSLAAGPKMHPVPRDGYGREIDYLRISLTDHCNLRCVYCMPLEGLALAPSSTFLSAAERYMASPRTSILSSSKRRIGRRMKKMCPVFTGKNTRPCRI